MLSKSSPYRSLTTKFETNPKVGPKPPVVLLLGRHCTLAAPLNAQEGASACAHRAGDHDAMYLPSSSPRGGVLASTLLLCLET
jgi:hypothetical protein